MTWKLSRYLFLYALEKAGFAPPFRTVRQRFVFGNRLIFFFGFLWGVKKLRCRLYLWGKHDNLQRNKQKNNKRTSLDSSCSDTNRFQNVEDVIFQWTQGDKCDVSQQTNSCCINNKLIFCMTCLINCGWMFSFLFLCNVNILEERHVILARRGQYYTLITVPCF